MNDILSKAQEILNRFKTWISSLLGGEQEESLPLSRMRPEAKPPAYEVIPATQRVEADTEDVNRAIEEVTSRRPVPIYREYK